MGESTTGETAPPAAPARGAGGAGRGAARVPAGPSSDLPRARAPRDPLADKRVYRPRRFHVPAARARPGAPLSPPGARFARPSTERNALLNRRERAVRARPWRERSRALRGARMKGARTCARYSRFRSRGPRARPCSVRAPHACAPRKATWLAVAAFGRGGKALAVRMRRFRSVVCARPRARRARPPRGHAPASAGHRARRGPCPRAGSRTRRNENRRCRARKRRTERDAPSATAPKARSKILFGACRSHRPRGCPGAKPHARRVGARASHAHPRT